MESLKNAGFTPSFVRKNRIFSESTMTKFRRGDMVQYTELDRLCAVLGLQPGDIVEYIPEDGEAVPRPGEADTPEA